MELRTMFSMQRTLDRRIESEHGLEREDLFDKKLLALFVEVGELANETRCFKFWSQKPASSKERILEEYVDGLHFILSLGIELGFDNEPYSISTETETPDATAAFLNVFDQIHRLKTLKNKEAYFSLIQSYIKLGHLLGFTGEDMYDGYVQKNELNHLRQDKGY
ncbi:dUTP diphosphatase [Fervidibacillus halotolerans]|uniref:dUTP diphosphatase n=1 Tax=Fervidibacillus halotolerans TaxID=2980027 RepID=A0A9E8RXW7_9BACI|nr:dUTP diphosphatase [Fervidibacillus halotolerans]WAA11639.1 dUTP diphosphatase [Fervidibacillus halotolerans]